MRFLRTANAGGLITLDGVRIAIDGVCGAVAPYLETPVRLREYLQEKVPDAVGFTHLHPDHFHPGYRDFCMQSATTLIMPGSSGGEVGPITVTPVPTRHLGKVEPELIHSSFLISGSQRVLFAGDASPAELKGVENVDVLIAPYAWLTTNVGLKALKAIGARKFILVHMPGVDPDPYGIWESTRNGIIECTDVDVFIPAMGQEITL